LYCDARVGILKLDISKRGRVRENKNQRRDWFRCTAGE
jgi:hypothetical protein